MDPMLTNDERRMREKMLPHDFPFDEKAWNEMEALLDRDRKGPAAGLPPRPPATPPPGPGKRRKVVALLFLAFALCSATLLWWKTGRRDARAPEQAQYAYPPALRPERQNAVESPQGGGGPALTKGAQASAALKPGVETGASNIQNSPLRGKNTAAPPNARPGNAGSALPDKALLPWEPESGLPQPPPAAFSDAPAAETSVISSDDFDCLPLAAPVFQRADSIILPAFDVVNSSKRWEYGWIAGLNANTVDLSPFRLNVLPHLGYLFQYRWRPGLYLQAEAVAKFVSGYQLHAEFLDIIPGGSSHIILNQNNLLFLEIPLLLKRTYAPGQSWFIGLKPSWNWVIAPYGSVSGTNNAPIRYISDHQGIRRFDLGLAAGWEWRFGPYWALDVRYNQGLYDLTIDSFYKSRETHLNSGLQVSLRHFFTKKLRAHASKTLFSEPAGRR